MGNGENIKFSHDDWMEESPLIDKIPLDRRSTIYEDIKVIDFITDNKTWKFRDLKQMLPSRSVEKIITIPIRVSNIKEKIIWKFFADGKFSVKTTL